MLDDSGRGGGGDSRKSTSLCPRQRRQQAAIVKSRIKKGSFKPGKGRDAKNFCSWLRADEDGLVSYVSMHLWRLTRQALI